MTERAVVVAIDGPAASGKGTLARRLAAALGLRHLDSGRLYRAAALRLREAGGRPGDADAAVAAARAIDGVALDDARLDEPEIARWASAVAAIPGVRAAVLDRQRRFAEAPPGAVVDGRDIGTVVFPDADVKLFLVADLAERARRRHAELVAAGRGVTLDEVRAELAVRDRRDGERPVAPMRPADDAVVLDTTNLDPDQAFDAAFAIVARKSGRTGGCGSSCDSGARRL